MAGGFCGHTNIRTDLSFHVFNVDRYYRIYRSLTPFLSLSPDTKDGNRSTITQLFVSSKTKSVDNGQY